MTSAPEYPEPSIAPDTDILTVRLRDPRQCGWGKGVYEVAYKRTQEQLAHETEALERLQREQVRLQALFEALAERASAALLNGDQQELDACASIYAANTPLREFLPGVIQRCTERIRNLERAQRVAVTGIAYHEGQERQQAERERQTEEARRAQETERAMLDANPVFAARQREAERVKASQEQERQERETQRQAEQARLEDIRAEARRAAWKIFKKPR